MQPQKRTIALGALAAVFIVAGAAAAAWWWLDGRWYEATDDAYAQGNLVQLTPQIGGIVVRINADDTALVRAGDPVVVLDAAATQTALATHPDVKQAAAKLGEAYLAAQRASIVAPVTGYVAKRSVQLGQQVAPGAALLAIVPLAQVWVDANFKETQLQHVRIGQPVTLTSDLYGGAVTYHGTVIGLGSGTGSAFALLPAQNATGNWIKIVQRLPVRIRLDPQELAARPLRLGLSMQVSIDTHDRSGPVLANAPSLEAALETKAYERTLDDATRLEREIVQANLGPGSAAAVVAGR